MLAGLSACLLSLSPAVAENSPSLQADLTKPLASPLWRFFETKWDIAPSPAGPILISTAEADNSLLYSLNRSVQPPVEIDFEFLVYNNKTNANRFRIGFYSDTGGLARKYEAEIIPGGPAKLYRLGGGMTELSKASDVITFPESTLSAQSPLAMHPVKGRLLFAKDHRLQLFIDGQLVLTSDRPVEDPLNIFAISIWSRIFKGEPANRVAFTKLSATIAP